VSAVLRLCLDLNIWCAAFLADRDGRQNTSAQLLVDAVRSGHCPLGPVQLVVSWGMLDRLRKVFVTDWQVDRATTDQLMEAIAHYSQLGPDATGPLLTLGGAGIMPLRDAEDAHVLDTAIAGDADLVATANFKDFLTRSADVLVPNRLARLQHPKGRLLIAHPFTLRSWFLAGRVELPDLH
jgi:predicted nucleic acid-binding protein